MQDIVTNGQHVALQEAVVIAKDIFRRFPGKHEKLVLALMEKALEFTEPDSRAALAWVMGEHAEKIKDCDKLFQEFFIEGFLEEADPVKL